MSVLKAMEKQPTRRRQADEVREERIKSNADLVQYIVGRIAINLPDRVDRDDLVSAGLMGLIKAADRFDESRGIKFRTYASSVIRGEIMESLRAKDWAPRSVRRKARDLASVVGELEARLQRPPTDVEIAEGLDIELNDYYTLLAETSGANLVSLDELVDEWQVEASDEYSQLAADDSSNPATVIDRQSLLAVVASAVDRLPERERLVVGLYYQDELTLQEIGQVIGVTESRVCQIHTQAITRLRATVQRELSMP
ncbi:MAG TPA: FliA/WhiG family RNA polymerase sigma factor [Armatimonadetes bacterium]|nr:FliA/WhiG family RNA polymerase sigma factor [Armatimonadota bacterium]